MKYIWFTKTNEEQVFDVIGDPRELRDLSGEAGAIGPLRERMAAMAERLGVKYERGALRACGNQTPAALGF